jgi:hypothetical protein
MACATRSIRSCGEVEMIASWISPALIAIIVSALVTTAGWFVTHRNSLNFEKERRLEKIRDFQIALRAEIRSELHHLNEENLDKAFKSVEAQYRASKTYSVYVPGLARHAVFDNLVRDIHILPESVIDPLILYSRQRQMLDQFSAEMRTDKFSKLSQSRQLAMYQDYVAVTKYLRVLAVDTISAIDAALANGKNQ